MLLRLFILPQVSMLDTQHTDMEINAQIPILDKKCADFSRNCPGRHDMMSDTRHLCMDTSESE